jgi:hypothetical protein
MEKESTPQSTTEKKADSGKKKAAGKNGSTTKKPAAKSATASKTTRTSTDKAETKGSDAKAKRAAPTQKAATNVKPGTRKKKVTPKDLIFKKFDDWKPAKTVRSDPVERNGKDVSPPPFVAAESESETARIKKLLFKKFDLAASQGPAAEADKQDMFDAKPADSPVLAKQADPVATTMKILILGLALLMALTIKFSVSNRANYYLKATDTGIEIRRGIFAPMGQELLFTLPDAEPPKSIQGVYTKQEIYPFVFEHYVKKADELLEKPGMPDFEGIKAYLNKAMPYAVTEKNLNDAVSRLNNIDLMILLYKADVAASRETLADYKAALEYLKAAATLDVDGSKSGLIAQKTKSIQSAIAALEAEEAAEPGEEPAIK